MQRATKAAATPNKPKTITEVPAQKTETKPVQTGSTKLARQIYEAVKDDLEGNFERFLDRSSMEEKRFINQVLVDWGSINSGRPREPGEYEVPIYSAVQLQLDGLHCLAIADEDMIPKIEQFIAALEKKNWKAKPYDWRNPGTSEEIRERFACSFRTDAEIFAREAGRPSLLFMSQILIRWSELAHDPDGINVPNALAAAVEIELDKLHAETAADTE